jgi:hypothetical protein
MKVHQSLYEHFEHRKEVIHCPPLPKSNYIPVKRVNVGGEREYEPALLDADAYWIGIFKYSIDQYSITDQEYEVVLDWLKNIFGPSLLRTQHLTKEEAREELHLDKASGFPWYTKYGPKKQDVVSKCTIEDIYEYFNTYCSIISSTLKGELRLKNKDARLFTPVPHEMAEVGNYLYAGQNEAIMQDIFNNGVTNGAQNPGADMLTVFSMLENHGGDKHATDGQQFDVRLMLFIHRLCRDLRTFYDRRGNDKLHRRYYNKLACAWVNVAGVPTRINNQKSGQTNTAIDNSIGQVAVLCLHAIRKGWSYERFRKEVLFFVNSDDMTFSDKTGVFAPERLCETYMSVGQFLETSSLAPLDITEVDYLAATPCWRQVGLRKALFYKYRIGKLLTAFDYVKPNQSLTDYFQKCVSLCILLFGHKDLFEGVRAAVLSWFTERLLHGDYFDMPICNSLVQLICDDRRLVLLYTRMESSASF